MFSLLVVRAHGRVPVAVAIARELDFPRLATDGAILDEFLTAPALILETEVADLAAIRTTDG